MSEHPDQNQPARQPDEQPGEQSGEPAASPGVQFNPQTGFPIPPSDPNAPPAYPTYPPQAPYGQPGEQYPQYPQQAYPQQPYPQQPNPYGQYPGYQQAWSAPELPAANTALIIGLISVFGAFTCLLPIVASPWAWVYGARARREIRESGGRFSGDGKATAGMILGIIGTVLLALLVLAVVVIVIAAVATDGFSDSGTGTRV